MTSIIEITIDEFKKEFLEKFEELFPEKERRPLNKITASYHDGVEKIFKIVSNNDAVGFILLEKLPSHPYYIDYFAIFTEYQGKGYGTEVIQLLKKEYIDSGIIAEIEKVEATDFITQKRLEFYTRNGFKTIDSEYFIYGVTFMPIVLGVVEEKETLDKIYRDYYIANTSEELVKKYFRKGDGSFF